MLKLFKTTLCALALISINAQADNFVSFVDKKITAVEFHDNGNIAVTFNSEVDPYCTQFGTNTILFRIGKSYVTEAGMKNLISASSTALVTQLKVDVIHDKDVDRYCYGRQIKLKKG